MEEKYIQKLDYLLESLRAHMNLFIYEAKAGLEDIAQEQLARMTEDLKMIQDTFLEAKKAAKGQKTSKKK